MYRSPFFRFAALLFLCAALFASPLARAQDNQLPTGAPGFAIGHYTNGKTYAAGQTFALPHGGTWGGALIAFSASSGSPQGGVRWELHRWITDPYYTGPGKLLAVGAFDPAPMAFNSLSVAQIHLPPGRYALLLVAVQDQYVGHYWNVLVTTGSTDRYTRGAFVQLEQGGAWGSWPDQDLHGEFDFASPDGFGVLITE